MRILVECPGIECRMRNAECGMPNAECRNAECRMRNAECGMRNLRNAEWRESAIRGMVFYCLLSEILKKERSKNEKYEFFFLY